MKLKLDLHGVIVEYERPPMPENRFRVLCLLAAAGVYGGMVAGVAALCGFPGVAAVGVATILAAMIVRD